MSHECQFCHRQYTIDFCLDEEIWEETKPPVGEGPICGVCIVERLEQKFEYGVFHISNIVDNQKDNNNILYMSNPTTLDIEPDRILRKAIGKLEGVVIAGYTKDSGDEYFASGYGNPTEVLWLLKRFEKQLLKDENEEEEYDERE